MNLESGMRGMVWPAWTPKIRKRTERMATVSIVVPNYNHEKYLRKRMESIFAQSYQDFELILLDDCSKDNSREILSSYAGDARVRLEFNQQNSGTPFKQWNKGVAMARGKYVWIAESDDYADTRLLEQLVNQLETQPEVTFAYCRSWEIGEDDRLRGYADEYLSHWDKQHWKENFKVSGLEECRRFFTLAAPVPNASAALFRKEIYERVGGADESLRICGDYKVWAAMALEGKIAYLGEPLNYYRTHEQNVRTRTKAGALGLAEYFHVMAWIVERVSRPEERQHGRQNDRFANVAPADMAPHERLRLCIDRMTRIANWNCSYNDHVPAKAVREHFFEWQLALYESEFSYLAPSRWRFLTYKWRFYGYYFPAMTWRLRIVNLLKLIGSPLLGYRHRHWPEQVYARALRK